MNTLTKKSSKQNSKKKKSKDNSGSGKIRRVLSKLSGAFMLPIAVMAIAGLMLGVGTTLASAYQNFINDVAPKDLESMASSIEYWRNVVVVGNFIKALGDPIFFLLPVLFAMAFVIAFTDEAGVAVFAAVIGYVVFIFIQSVFITPVTENVPGTIETPAVVDSAGNVIKEATPVTKIVGYQVIFTQGGRDPVRLLRLVQQNLGVTSLQTSVFGGIVVGLIVQKLYNKFHTIQLPTVISFFGGKRFVAIITILAMVPTALLFLVFWPWIGIGLNTLGESLAKVPYGLESLIFGFVERSLIPFGLHHVFYAPLWYTPIGGDLQEAIKVFNETHASMPGFKPDEALTNFFNAVNQNPGFFQGDSVISININGIGPDVVGYSVTGDGGETITKTYKLLDFISAELGIKVGRFLNGKYSFMILGLPAAGLAMIFAAPKENRKVAAGAVIPAALTSIITGVTEPIEFTFLFLAPWLFWGFHATMAALSFWAANLLNVHTGMAFSGGFLDLLIYGIIPFNKGTHFWWSLVVGAGYAPIYFIVFYFSIKKFNLDTPGRGSNIKLFSKADFISKKNKQELALAGGGTISAAGVQTESGEQEVEVDPRALAVVQAYGGLSNITAFNNCASRLRYDVVDSDLVNVDKLKSTGAMGVKVEGKTHVQAIYGPIAEQLNSKIKSLRGEIARWEARQVLLAQEEKQGKDLEEIIQPTENIDALIAPTDNDQNHVILDLQDEETKNYRMAKRAYSDYEATLLANQLNNPVAVVPVVKSQSPYDEVEQADAQLESENDNVRFDYRGAEIDRMTYQDFKRYNADVEAAMLSDLLNVTPVSPIVPVEEELQETSPIIAEKQDENKLNIFEEFEQNSEDEEQTLSDSQEEQKDVFDFILEEMNNSKPETDTQTSDKTVEEVLSEQSEKEQAFDKEQNEIERQYYQFEKRSDADYESHILANALMSDQPAQEQQSEQVEEIQSIPWQSQKLEQKVQEPLASTEPSLDQKIKDVVSEMDHKNKVEDEFSAYQPMIEETQEEIVKPVVESKPPVKKEEPVLAKQAKPQPQVHDGSEILSVEEYLEKINDDSNKSQASEPGKNGETIEAESEEEDKELVTQEDGTVKSRYKDQIVYSPAIGKLRTLKSLRDGVISESKYGDGFAVRFAAEKIGRVYAPFDSKVIRISDEKHQYVIRSRKGVEVTLQIGIGAEALNGEGFKSFVYVDQQVKAGDIIVEFDITLLKKARLRNDLIFILSPNSRRTELKITKEERDLTRIAAEVAKISKASE